MTKTFLLNLAWVPAAALLGFTIAAVFPRILRLPRGIYLITYLLLAGIFFFSFFRWIKRSMVELVRHNWVMRNVVVKGFSVPSLALEA